MTRREALTRAAELIRLHMATPDAEALAALATIERDVDDMARDNIRMAGDLRDIRTALGLSEAAHIGTVLHHVRKAVERG